MSVALDSYFKDSLCYTIHQKVVIFGFVCSDKIHRCCCVQQCILALVTEMKSTVFSVWSQHERILDWKDSKFEGTHLICLAYDCCSRLALIFLATKNVTFYLLFLQPSCNYGNVTNKNEHLILSKVYSTILSI